MQKIEIIIPLLSLFGGAVAYFLDRFVITRIQKKETEKLEWYKTKLEKVLTPLFTLLSELLYGKNIEKTRNDIKSILMNHGFLLEDELYDDIDELIRIDFYSSPQYVWNVLIIMEYIVDQTEKIRKILYSYPLEIEKEELLKSYEKLLFKIGKRVIEIGKYIFWLFIILIGAYLLVSFITLQFKKSLIILGIFFLITLVLYFLIHKKVTNIERKLSQSAPYEEFKSQFKKRWLQEGHRGKDVVVLQKILFNLEYNIGSQLPDGIFGPETAESIKKFQRDVGLKPDGIVGPETRYELCKAYLNKLRNNEEKTGT